MSEQTSNRRSLSEISHLFLSSVREKQMGGAPAPKRRPPVHKASVDLTAEEVRQVMGPAKADEPMRVGPVTAVIASHLGVRQFEGAERYARHLCASGRRVGLIVIDVSEFRLVRFDAQAADEASQPVESGCFDARAMADAINELSCDVDCWLLLAANPRASEAKALLRQVDSWVAVCTCDYDGIVACYRTLKGLADLHPGGPKLRLATLDARSDAEAGDVFRRLGNVCGQFLNWRMESGGTVLDAPNVGQSPVMCCQVVHDKAQLAATVHWQVVGEFLQRAKASATEAIAEAPAAQAGESATVARPAPGPLDASDGEATPEAKMNTDHAEGAHHQRSMVGPQQQETEDAEVIELPVGEGGDDALLAAVMKHWMADVVECPVRAPMCPQARLAVSREKRLVLIAAAKGALSELQAIGQAYRWLTENRALVGMALPQFALDAHQLPHLRLLVDQAETSADVLHSMFAAETVEVQTYRRVRWGERRGLLLEAA